jgi:hypothetical protein
MTFVVEAYAASLFKERLRICLNVPVSKLICVCEQIGVGQGGNTGKVVKPVVLKATKLRGKLEETKLDNFAEGNPP